GDLGGNGKGDIGRQQERDAPIGGEQHRRHRHQPRVRQPPDACQAPADPRIRNPASEKPTHAADHIRVPLTLTSLCDIPFRPMKHDLDAVPVRRYTVDAAAKALDLLSAFSFREPRLSLADLATRTRIPRPTAFRLLTTLEQAGFVAKLNGEYQLGIKCFVLGNVVASSLDLREKALAHLERLRDLAGETVHLAVLDERQVLYLQRPQSPQPLR